MKTSRTITLVLFVVLSLSPLLSNRSTFTAQGASQNTRLEVWSPDTHSSNITDLSLTPGATIQVNVNVTGTTRLVGFDVSLDYNITVGPNVLQAIAATSGLTGGLFDPTSNPGGCNIQPVKSDIDKPAGKIRFTAITLSQCSEPGTGMLFSITFVVTGIGATSIDLVTAQSLGRPGSSIVGTVGNSPTIVNVPYDAFSAYFRNKAGLSPVPQFTFTPSNPEIGDIVHFDATASYDPDNRAALNNGMGIETIVYDSNKDNLYNTGKFYNDTIIIGSAPANNTRLKTDNKLAFVDLVGDSVWHPGETVVWDSTQSRVFAQNDFVIAGPSTTVGTALKFDPLIKYVDTHAHGFWDNGYVWDFGDGSPFVTGNVTSHVYTIGPNINATGLFPTKLVVFDSDNNLPNRQIQIVNVGPGRIYDVSVSLVLSKPTLNVGESLGIAVQLKNLGNQPIDDASLDVTYDLNTATTIDSRTGISLPVQASKTYNYTLDTSALTPGVYTVTAKAVIINATSGQPIPNANPDNFSSNSFSVLRALFTHDVGILTVSPEISTVSSGQTVLVDVVVANFGSQPESVSVALFYDFHTIRNVTGIQIPANPSYPPSTNVIITWDTSGVPTGTYTLSARVYLTGDPTPSDNTFVDGSVTIVPPPTMTLSPSSGIVGSQVVVQGSGFSPSPYGLQELEISFDSQFLGFAFPANGNFTFIFNVPVADPTRPHQVIAVGLINAFSRLASAPFTVLPTPGPPAQLDVRVDAAAVYFPGDTAVIYIQTSLNGVPVAPDSLEVSLANPSGSIVPLTSTSIQPGRFKASFLIPSRAAVGTYAVWVTARKAGSVDGVSEGAFEVKPSWIRAEGPMITGGVATVALLGLVVAWQKGYFRRKPEGLTG